MDRHSIKTYGIRTGWNKGKIRYFVVCNGKSTLLDYAKADFALKKSYELVKACYKPFTDLQGNKVTFEYKRQ